MSPRIFALPTVLTGVFMTILDFSIVNVTIPSIQHSLHASAAQIQLVVAGYSLSYGAGLVTGGRLGDRFGRRRLFGIGLALFTITSLACGLAPTAGTLVVARLAQGAAAAVLFPQSLSILNVTYTGAARVRAFTWYGIVLGTAMVGGQILGGALIRANLFGVGWRACFLINLPVGVVALAATFRVIEESRSATTRRFDLLGVLLSAVGLALLVFPLVEGRQAGWPLWAFGCLAAAVPVLWIFGVHQRRLANRGGSPLVEPALVASRSFVTGVATVFATYASMASFFLVFAVYLQEGEGYDALGSGVAFLPLGIAFFVTSLLGGRLTKLLGRFSISVGALLLGLSEAVLAVVVWSEGTRPDAWTLAPALAGVGVGMGMVLTPLISRALAGVHPDHAGSASGVLSTTQQIGNSVGVALIGIIFYGLLGTGYAPAFADSMIYTIGMAMVVAVAALSLPRSPTTPTPQQAAPATVSRGTGPRSS